MALVYERWKREDANLHPYDSNRRGYRALAHFFGVSLDVARHAVAYGRER